MLELSYIESVCSYSSFLMPKCLWVYPFAPVWLSFPAWQWTRVPVCVFLIACLYLRGAAAAVCQMIRTLVVIERDTKKQPILPDSRLFSFSESLLSPFLSQGWWAFRERKLALCKCQLEVWLWLFPKRIFFYSLALHYSVTLNELTAVWGTRNWERGCKSTGKLWGTLITQQVPMDTTQVFRHSDVNLHIYCMCVTSHYHHKVGCLQSIQKKMLHIVKRAPVRPEMIGGGDVRT